MIHRRKQTSLQNLFALLYSAAQHTLSSYIPHISSLTSLMAQQMSVTCRSKISKVPASPKADGERKKDAGDHAFFLTVAGFIFSRTLAILNIRCCCYFLRSLSIFRCIKQSAVVCVDELATVLHWRFPSDDRDKVYRWREYVMTYTAGSGMNNSCSDVYTHRHRAREANASREEDGRDGRRRWRADREEVDCC